MLVRFEEFFFSVFMFDALVGSFKWFGELTKKVIDLIALMTQRERTEISMAKGEKLFKK